MNTSTQNDKTTDIAFYVLIGLMLIGAVGAIVFIVSTFF